jgi:hypothetical protein
MAKNQKLEPFQSIKKRFAVQAIDQTIMERKCPSLRVESVIPVLIGY